MGQQNIGRVTQRLQKEERARTQSEHAREHSRCMADRTHLSDAPKRIFSGRTWVLGWSGSPR